jgi:hypothetical protein
MKDKMLATMRQVDRELILINNARLRILELQGELAKHIEVFDEASNLALKQEIFEKLKVIDEVRGDVEGANSDVSSANSDLSEATDALDEAIHALRKVIK